MISKLKSKFNDLISDPKFSEIITGSVWALSARVASAGIGILVSIIIARFYSAEMLGIVAILQSFFLLATIFTVLGTNISLLRLIPEHIVKYSPTSAFKVYRKTSAMVITTSIVIGALFFICNDLIALKIFSKQNLSFYFALASGFVVFNALMKLNTYAIRGLRLIKAFALMQILPQGFNLFLLVIIDMFWHNKDIPVYALLGSFAMTAILGWIIIEITFQKMNHSDDRTQYMSLRNILSISSPMLMTNTMTFVIGQTGVIILGMFRSAAEVGYYAIAVKLATLTAIILNAVNAMAAPKFSELYHSDNRDELFYVARKSAKLIFWTTMPILIFLVVFGKPVLYLMYGKPFTAAFWAMAILVVGQFVNSISGPTEVFMNMIGHQKELFLFKMISALINLGLNLVLTPRYGIYGASFSAMFSLSFWNILVLIYIKFKYDKSIGYLSLKII